MKVRRLSAAALLLAPIMFTGMTEPAQAANPRVVSISGDLVLLYHGGSEKQTWPIRKGIFLRHGGGESEETISVTGCLSGDIKGVLTVRAKLADFESISLDPRLSLYQGKCTSHDRIAVDYGPIRPLRPGKSLKWHLHATSTVDLVPSFAAVSFTATYANVPPPNEPGAVTVRTLPPDPVKPIERAVIQWKDRADDEKGYEILNTSTGQTRSVPPNRESYEWAKLAPAGPQCFMVRALGALGHSAWSSTECEVL